MAKEVRKEITSLDGAQAPPLRILRGVNLAVQAGETIAIVGASGSGKTTLLSLLAGLDSPTAGEIHLAGARIDTLAEDDRARARAGTVGFVFQSFQLLSGFTALENVMLPAELAGLGDPRARAREALARVGLDPLALGPKDGLAICNSSAASAGQAALVFCDAAAMWELAQVAAALSMEGFRANLSPLDPRASAARPAPGQE
ncbi:MAG: aromatic amino acid lyase, partial [Nevskiaceae bacterium]